MCFNFLCFRPIFSISSDSNQCCTFLVFPLNVFPFLVFPSNVFPFLVFPFCIFLLFHNTRYWRGPTGSVFPLLNFQSCKIWIIPNIIANILLLRLSLVAKMQINWVRLVNIYSNCRGLCLVLEHLWRRHCGKHSKIVRLRGKSKKFYCVWVNFVEEETGLPYVLERRCSELIMGCPHATRNDGSRK